MRSGQRETVTLMSTVKIQLLGLLLLISSCPFGAHGAQPPSKLKIGILKRPEACALKSKAGDLLSVYSVGKVHKTNKVFDEREVVGEPFKFLLGEGQVIRGWEQGLLGMCIGEVRRLVIPSELAYGERGAPPFIPANTAIVYEIEMTDITRKQERGSE
eukprot:m.101518 g.101518  ORF g.101518 m.101518 type:complete len:158 (-) comp20758_c0_seq4:121-594(-)